ncbi:MAG: hypothetical protein AAFX06_06355 [Planctomycetota bacterium]
MSWIRPTLLTLELMCFSGLIAAMIGVALAWSVSQLNTTSRFLRLIRLYVLLCAITALAVPMILHAAAWEATAGKFGWLTFSQTAARTYTGFAGQYGGMVACAWVHGLVGAALVALATWFGMTRIPVAVSEQARLDGQWGTAWWRVLLPIAWPWVVGALLIVTMLAATEMTVVNLYGVRTLADEFYLRHAHQPSSVSLLMVLVAPAALCIGIVTWATTLRRRIPPWSSKAVAREPISEAGGVARGIAVMLALSLATLLTVFPLSGLVLKTGHQVTVDADTGDASIGWSLQQVSTTLGRAPAEFGREYVWTMILACLVPLLCVPLAWGLGAVSRSRAKLRSVLDFGSLLMFLIPGPMVGLLVIRFFAVPVPGFRELYTTSLLPTVLALSFRALPICYWILRTGYAATDTAVLDQASLELSWWRRLWWIDRGLLARPLALATLISAVYSSGDVPATLPVVPPEVVTVGTRLFALLHSGARYQEAALAFWYVAAVVTVTLLMTVRWKPLDP